MSAIHILKYLSANVSGLKAIFKFTITLFFVPTKFCIALFLITCIKSQEKLKTMQCLCKILEGQKRVFNGKFETALFQYIKILTCFPQASEAS